MHFPALIILKRLPMFKSIKIIGIAVCIITGLAVILPSCSKEEMTYQKIKGTWYLTNDPACRWTFDKHDRLHINKLGPYHNLDCRYTIENNTLCLHLIKATENGMRITGSNLSIDYIHKNNMRISGTIRLQEYEYHDDLYSLGNDEEVEINYEFQKSN